MWFGSAINVSLNSFQAFMVPLHRLAKGAHPPTIGIVTTLLRVFQKPTETRDGVPVTLACMWCEELTKVKLFATTEHLRSRLASFSFMGKSKQSMRMCMLGVHCID
jgi:hypothetical protein